MALVKVGFKTADEAIVAVTEGKMKIYDQGGRRVIYERNNALIGKSQFVFDDNTVVVDSWSQVKKWQREQFWYEELNNGRILCKAFKKNGDNEFIVTYIRKYKEGSSHPFIDVFGDAYYHAKPLLSDIVVAALEAV